MNLVALNCYVRVAKHLQQPQASATNIISPSRSIVWFCQPQSAATATPITVNNCCQITTWLVVELQWLTSNTPMGGLLGGVAWAKYVIWIVLAYGSKRRYGQHSLG